MSDKMSEWDSKARGDEAQITLFRLRCRRAEYIDAVRALLAHAEAWPTGDNIDDSEPEHDAPMLSREW